MARPLHAELYQLAPFQSGEEEAYLSLIRTADLVQRRLNDLFKRFELTHTQYNVLRILRGAGTGGLLTGEVAERLVTQDPDVTRLLERLVQRGWVERTRGVNDRRCVRASLTGQGREVVDSLDGPVASFLKSQFAGVSEPARRSLLRTLGELRSSDLSSGL